MDRAYAYASTVDVLQHLTLAASFTATSTPNATQVHRQLHDVSNELDSALAHGGYSYPVTATGASAAFSLLNTYAAIGAAMYVSSSHPAGKASPQLAFLERRWLAIIDDLREGAVEIPGLPFDTATSLPRFPPAAADGASAYFTRSFEPDGF